MHLSRVSGADVGMMVLDEVWPPDEERKIDGPGDGGFPHGSTSSS
jgi:hypothetical protein